MALSSSIQSQSEILTDEQLWEIREHVAKNEVSRHDDSKTICIKHGRAIERAVLALRNQWDTSS